MLENHLSVMSDRLLSKETTLPNLAGYRVPVTRFLRAAADRLMAEVPRGTKGSTPAKAANLRLPVDP